jgi:hypothetical protein
MESLHQRREELEKKELQLKESVLKFDKFLKVFECLDLIIERTLEILYSF